jgi:VanZ family protein
LFARIAWALLCAFIAYGSLGTWAANEPAIWAPTLVVFQDVVLNVGLYVVFGVLAVLSLRDTYRRHWLRLVCRVIAIAMLFSFANEMLQLYTIDRVASLTDIASAAIGAFIGGAGAAMLSASGHAVVSGRPR